MDQDKLKKYEEYFKDDLSSLDNELKKIDKYSENIDKQLERFDGINAKGGMHYLIEHYKNAATIQTQKISVLKDKVALKKLIMDYSIKELDKDKENNESFANDLRFLVEDAKSRAKKAEKALDRSIDTTKIDSIIDQKINEQK